MTGKWCGNGMQVGGGFQDESLDVDLDVTPTDPDQQIGEAVAFELGRLKARADRQRFN